MTTTQTGRWAAQGRNVRRARERAGISQENFAPLIGTTRRHMIRLEKGIHRPGPALLARIAEHTNQSPDSFGYPDDSDDPG